MRSVSLQAGFILLPVLLTLFLVATLAFVINRDSSSNVTLSAMQGQSQQLDYAAQAGLQHAQWVLDQGACTGYSLPATNFGEYSYSATFTPTSGSPVAITATATLAGGSSYTLTQGDTVAYQSEVNVVQQPDAAVGKDAFLNESDMSLNYGASNFLPVQDVAGYEIRSVLQFDVSSLPATSKILSAVLSLYQNDPSAAGGTVVVRRLTNDWTEGDGDGASSGGVTWNDRSTGVSWTQGGAYTGTFVASTAILASTVAWFEWDITALTQAWFEGSMANQGLILLPDAAGTKVTFASSDAADAALHPKLTITYICECGGGAAGSAVIQPAATGEDAHVSEGGAAATNFGNSAFIEISNKANNSDHGLIRFDLSGLPATAIINSAELELNLEELPSVIPQTISVHQVTTDWTESLVNWNAPSGGGAWTTPGGDFVATPVDSTVLVPLVLGPKTFDITALVTQWHGGTANYGLLLTSSVDANNIRFTSSDGATASQRPKLTVNFSCSCGVACAYTSPVSSCNADYLATTKVGEFSTAAYSATQPRGVTFLPADTVFMGVSAPSAGAILTLDGADNLHMSASDGTLLASCAVPAFGSGVTFVESGAHTGQLALSIDTNANAVNYLDMSCNVLSAFSTDAFSVSPAGVGYLGTTASGTYDGHLAIADETSPYSIYLVQQDGTLALSVDISALGFKPKGAAHIPGTDKLLLPDQSGNRVVVIDFSSFAGSADGIYDTAAFGANQLQGVAINSETCDHLVVSDAIDSVVALNATGGGVGVTLNSDADSYAEESAATSVKGLANQIILKWENNKIRQGMVHFDTTSISPGTTVSTAQLRLWVKDNRTVDDAVVSVYQLTESWEEAAQCWNERTSSASWSTPGGTHDATVIASMPLSAGVKNVWLEWDITPLVQEWVDFPANNFGVLLKSDVVKDIKFSSREANTSAVFPQLIIVTP